MIQPLGTSKRSSLDEEAKRKTRRGIDEDTKYFLSTVIALSYQIDEEFGGRM